MKNNYLTINNLSTGAFLLCAINAGLFTWLALAKVTVPAKDNKGEIVMVGKSPLMKTVSPSPIDHDKAHWFYGLWAGVNYCFAFSLWNSKKLTICKKGEGEVLDLPLDIKKLLINRGYVTKSGPLLDQKTFADDCVETCQKLLVNTAHLGFSVIEDGLTLGSDGALTAGKKLYSMSVPEETRTYLETRFNDITSNHWNTIKNADDIHFRIVGIPRSGKTTTALNYIRCYYEKYQGLCDIWVGDINYLKPDNGDDMNTWFDLDERRVLQDVGLIMGKFQDLAAEVDRRKAMNKEYRQSMLQQGKEARNISKIKHLQKPVLFVIDEWGSVAEGIDNIDDKFLPSVVAPLLKQCLGYGIQILVIDHSLAVGCGKISEYLGNCFNNAFVLKDQFDTNNLGKMGVTGPAVKEIQDRISHLKDKGAKRIMVSEVPGMAKPQAFPLPELSQTDWQFPKLQESDWVHDHQSEVLTLIKEGKSITNIFQHFLEKNIITVKRQSPDNPYYKALKDFYEQNQPLINLTKSEV